MQYKILLTDSDSYNLDILKQYLSTQPYEIEIANHADQVWDILKKPDGSKILLMLLDADLPGAGQWGLDLLKKIKRDPIFRTRPIMMQTTRINPAELQSGIDCGAKYFLSKPFTQMRFVSLVRAAIEEYSHFVGLQEALEKGTSGLQLLQTALFKFQTLQEADTVSLILARACPDPSQIILGLFELLINAVEHGNLEIGYDLKSTLVQNGMWEQEMTNRLTQEKYKNRCVTAEFTRDSLKSEIKITVTDQGSGFDWQKYLEYNPVHAFDGHGRGIMTAKQFCFKRLEFNPAGNAVSVWI